MRSGTQGNRESSKNVDQVREADFKVVQLHSVAQIPLISHHWHL